jgi:hypothetical protein
MANAQQLTRRTRLMDIKHFALLDWVEQDLQILEQIPTNDNAADAMTKTGIRIPEYTRSNKELIQYGKATSHAMFTDSSNVTAAHSMGGTRPTYII